MRNSKEQMIYVADKLRDLLESIENILEGYEGIELLKKAQIYAQRIDWLLSGDDGEDTFHKRLSQDLSIYTVEEWRTVADHLTDYLNGKEYKPKQDEDMDKVIELLNIKFDHDDMNELYWYDGNCA